MSKIAIFLNYDGTVRNILTTSEEVEALVVYVDELGDVEAPPEIPRHGDGELKMCEAYMFPVIVDPAYVEQVWASFKTKEQLS